MWTHEVEAAILQFHAMRITIMGSISDPRDLAADHGHFRGEVFDE